MSRPETPDWSDVRTRGFASRSTVEQAWTWIEKVLPRFLDLSVEDVSLDDCVGRILARDVRSERASPAFARAMMDGLALRGESTHGATAYNPLAFQVLGASLPGREFDGVVGPGEAVRIMTGAPLPVGADAVLPFEQVKLVDEGMAEALADVPPGKNIGRPGEDVAVGDLLRAAGGRIRPQDVGLFSSVGLSKAPVVRRPRVRIVVTGDEVLPAGTPPTGYRIADANGPMLAALVKRDGGEIVSRDMVRDDRGRIAAAIAAEADVVLVSGGSSVGQEDHAPTVLAELGELAIHGVAMRPSSPAGMGRIGKTLVFLAPGNPVSCLCAYDFFAGRAIRRLAGDGRDWPYASRRGRLRSKLVSVVGRVDYARVRLAADEVEPISVSGASILSSTTRADGFVVVPGDSEGFPAGASVEIFLY